MNPVTKIAGNIDKIFENRILKWFNKKMDVNLFYKKYFNIDAIFSHQQEMWEQVNKNRFPILLKAPTGSGKTEAIIAPFLKQFIDNKFCIAPRLIYVLPMRGLVNSIAERIKSYTEKISKNISVEIQHGDIPNAPFFIADIVVTTLDQFFYGFARASNQVGRHIDMPAGSIASSMVVFDEAHMYRDEFTFSIMRALIEILQKCHIPFIIMTATMPKSLEESLFEDQELFNEVTSITGGIPFKSDIKITIENEPLYVYEEVCISEKLLKKIKEHKTLIVVNQVKRAQKIYDEIKERLRLTESEIVLLHSRFTRIDRMHHESKAISIIPHKKEGKKIFPKGTGIVVSTQVLEAGIDFSANLLITELAPADSLIQRAGRCSRYEGESGEIIVFPVDNEKGYLPYKKEHLERTFNYLKSNFNFNIKDFEQVCNFVNILDYKANDFEARDTLIDLYECVLYADNIPTNIQVRESKPVTLVVLDIPEGVRINESLIKELILKTDLKEHSITVNTGIAWSLFNNEGIDIQWEIKKWNYNEKLKKFEPVIIDIMKSKKIKTTEDERIGPFRTYIINRKNYEKNKGIVPDVSLII